MQTFLETSLTAPQHSIAPRSVAGNDQFNQLHDSHYLYRIVDFERDPPPGVTNIGKLNVELWDVSGDFRYEKCWAPIQKDAHGIIFVYDPTMANAEETLNQLVNLFPKAMMLQPKFCMVYINHHNVGGAGA